MALLSFCEKYDGEAIESITIMSNDISLTHHKFDGMKLNESAAMFVKALRGYVDLCCEHVTDEESTQPADFITECNTYIATKLFSEEKIPYQHASSMVSSYLEHIHELESTEDELKTKMLEAGTPGEQVGGLTDMVEVYLSQLDEKMESVMDGLLWASGYRSKERLSKAGSTTKPQHYIV